MHYTFTTLFTMQRWLEAAWSGNPGKLSLFPWLIPKWAQGFGITFYTSKKQVRSLGTGPGICVCFGITWPKMQITCRDPHVQSWICFVPVLVIWRMDYGRVSGCRDHARTTDRMSLKSWEAVNCISYLPLLNFINQGAETSNSAYSTYALLFAACDLCS